MSIGRYKISDKNIYGFKTNMYQTFLWIPVMMILALIVEFVLGPVMYKVYQKNAALDEGEVGNKAVADMPIAESIADMEQMGTFTMIIQGNVLKYDTVRVEEQIYHRITLPSGEKVIAHINLSARQETDDIGAYLMPAGEWKEWEAPAEIMVFEEHLTVTDHYIDMYGDFVPVLSQSAYTRALGSAASAWIYVIVLLLYRVIGIRKGRFAPAFFWKWDPLLPRNDMECWCASTFAIWSHSFDMLEGWPLVTGVHRRRKVVANFREVALGEQWEIKNRQEGLATVHELVEEHAGRLDSVYPGWDLCRATQILGMMYMVKMIDRDEMDREFGMAGKVIQQRFSSWDEMAESYLEGFRSWRERIGDKNAISAAERRRNIFMELKADKYGPYSMPWRTDLNWVPGNEKGEQKEVKRILTHYQAKNRY